ncbi:MAG: hypothetical protein EOR16_31010 [Mesorhizobium sp.]|uniref:hypothetical protein n=1 Tax=Mesorhizobium sp. TaxID=1871066 RepID=UPI000FE886FE|nr:hypothetical protein [Mesorhizobium sp.]RWI50085.1 MAG: hypothetical protein EOR16_31010 [Mesorhizobium sp.]
MAAYNKSDAIAAVDAVIEVFNSVEPASPEGLKPAVASLAKLLKDHPLAFLSTGLSPNEPIIHLPGMIEARSITDDDIKNAFDGRTVNDIISAMADPGLDLGDPGNATPEQITGAKRVGLYLCFCLKLMIVIAITGGSWINTRNLGGPSVFTRKGQGSAAGAGAVGAISQVALSTAFDQFLTWLNMCPAFEGEDVSAIADITKNTVTGFLGATTVTAVLEIIDHVENKTPYQYFGLYALAFFFIGSMEAAGERLVGRQIMARPRPFLESINKKETAAQFFLFLTLWYSYWDYYEGFLLLANTSGQRTAVVWGTLGIFFQLFHHGDYGIARFFSKPRNLGLLNV